MLKSSRKIATESFKIGNHTFDQQRAAVDAYVKQINEVWIKNLLHDITLEEAFNIVCDYIALNSLK